MENRFYVGIDLGTGSGAKIGVFQDSHHQWAEGLLPRESYGDTLESLGDALFAKAMELVENVHLPSANLRAVGVATPGLLHSDRSYALATNLPFLNEKNLPAYLENRFQKPVAIDNDANAGALAEWSVVQTEILYWVFGGDWGGAWVSKEGRIQFPAIDWDGQDENLHITNEPGYVAPINKETLRAYLSDAGADPDHYFSLLRERYGSPLKGPGDDAQTLRAGMILSGPGRHRLFQALTREDRSYEAHLSDNEKKQIQENPAEAGALMARLSQERVHCALQVDRLFGRLLAEAGDAVLSRAITDGCREDVPVFLGGKPSYALPYFGPTCQRHLGRKRRRNYLRPSNIDDRGLNANLVGAVVLAENSRV